jgi:hypothetical protein
MRAIDPAITHNTSKWVNGSPHRAVKLLLSMSSHAPMADVSFNVLAFITFVIKHKKNAVVVLLGLQKRRPSGRYRYPTPRHGCVNILSMYGHKNSRLQVGGISYRFCNLALQI